MIIKLFFTGDYEFLPQMNIVIFSWTHADGLVHKSWTTEKCLISCFS